MGFLSVCRFYGVLETLKYSVIGVLTGVCKLPRTHTRKRE